MVTADIARNAEIASAIDNGLALTQDDAQQLTSNSDAVITLYSMIDGEPRPVQRIHAERVLKKRLPDGKPAFWAPGMSGEAPEYAKGNVACYLHPDFDESEGPAGFDRMWLDSIGLRGRTCNMSDTTKKNRADFRSIYDRDDHAMKKHRREWAIIQAALTRAREQKAEEDRRLDREAMLALAGRAVSAPAMAEPQTSTPPVAEAKCDLCDYTNSQANVNRHKAQVHRE